MIAYHHRNDVFNCMYRILSLFYLLGSKGIEIERLKIIDFYFTFPYFLVESKLPQKKGNKEIRNLAEKLIPPYEKLPSKKILFSEMGDIQSRALDILICKGVLELYDGKWLKKGALYGTHEIAILVESNDISCSIFYQKIVDQFLKFDLYGKLGLKAKTELMEYRYDAI